MNRVEYNRRYYAEHKSRLCAREKERYERDPEKVRAYKVLKAHGITEAEYQAILQHQGGVCALCGKQRQARRLAVDHDHKTGKIRGILCLPCNSALGTLGDDVESLIGVIRYLEGSNGSATAVSRIDACLEKGMASSMVEAQ